ncbi:MAG: arginyl-tRNA--protein-N-Asp/Glu arginylyltransferase, partial [Gammaproteobacteria bacterium]
MSDRLQLFKTQPDKCGYLDGLQSQNLVVDPDLLPDRSLQTLLANAGFRRSGNMLYRPNCPSCQACKATRVPVERFIPSRRQKRVLKKNVDLSVFAVSAVYSEEHYQLFAKYLKQRHADGGMDDTSEEGYRSFLLGEWSETVLLEIRDSAGRLMAVAVTDVLDNGLSAVYTFFDPDESARSLGGFAILSQIR